MGPMGPMGHLGHMATRGKPRRFQWRINTALVATSAVPEKLRSYMQVSYNGGNPDSWMVYNGKSD
jgi:hypothetical protein